MGSLKEILPIRFNSSGINYLNFSWCSGCETFPYHFHERIEILFVEQGELQIFIDEKNYIAQAGQTVVVSPFSKHKGVSGPNGVKYHVITFKLSDFTNASLASKKYLSSLNKHAVAFEPINDNPVIISAVKELIAYLDENSTANPLCSMGKMYELIGLLHQFASVSKSTVQETQKEDNFNEILQYIDTNFLSNISTKDISEKFGYNTAYFCRKFRNETGTTVMSYIRSLKLEYGKDLLLASNDSINNIAWKSGFSDKSHFSNCFKRLYKISPIKYRKAHKKASKGNKKG